MNRENKQKTGVALLIHCRGHCELLWAVVPPLQVVLSSACSVASLGRFPSHYLPGRLCLRPGVLADHLFGWGIPSTRQAGHETVHNASSVKSLSRRHDTPQQKEMFRILCNGNAAISPLFPKLRFAERRVSYWQFAARRTGCCQCCKPAETAHLA